MRDIDPAWWRSAALNARPMPTYLRERDFGAVFRFLRSRGWSRASIASATGLSETRVREISTGRQRVTSYEVLERLADGLRIERGLVGLAYLPDLTSELDPTAAPPIDPLPGRPVGTARLSLIKGGRGDPTADPLPGAVPSCARPGPARRPEPDGIDPTGFTGATTRIAIQSLLDSLTSALNDRIVDAACEPLPSLAAVARQTDRAKADYQSCRYDAVLRDLPLLLTNLDALQEISDEGGPAHRIAADAYHVAGSVLLKVGDTAFAAIAADRSMTAARRSGDPIAIAATARILTHSLFATGHGEQAQAVAVRAADQLEHEVPLDGSADARSVYGALILRGAVACARTDRSTAYALLDRAAAAAHDLRDDDNIRWTGFGPTNVLLHRVNVALVLGDAGSAVEAARQVDVRDVPIAERRATFYLDVAQAYHQWGRYDEAFGALDAANRVAPQEIWARPSAGRLVTEMAARAPETSRPQIRDFARAAGITL